MSKVYHTSDWHLGHKNILKYRPKFKSIEEHDNTLFSNYLKIITKHDTVYFHGDMIFDKSYFDRFKSLPGRKILILGNHCTDFLKTSDYFEVFDKVYSILNKKGAWFTHAPIHPDELRGKINIHGHTHENNIKNINYFNVCVENTNYMPISRFKINEIMNSEIYTDCKDISEGK